MKKILIVGSYIDPFDKVYYTEPYSNRQSDIFDPHDKIQALQWFLDQLNNDMYKADDSEKIKPKDIVCLMVIENTPDYGPAVVEHWA